MQNYYKKFTYTNTNSLNIYQFCILGRLLLWFEDFLDHADNFRFAVSNVLAHLVIGLRKQVLEHRQRDEREDRQRSDSDHQIEGYFEYVVPPLEGFWWQEGVTGVDYTHKENFEWISLIRLPDFVTKVDFEWAIQEATSKKKTDFSKVEFLTYDEGLCVQCMHIGPYDNEPATVELMHQFMSEQGYALDITDSRYHHEIYLSDARKTTPDKLKTVIRHPIKAV